LSLWHRMKTLGEIAKIIKGTVKGNSECRITGFAGIEDAEEGDITFLENKRYLKFLRTTRASAIIISPDIVSSTNLNFILHKSPSEAFAIAVEALSPLHTQRHSRIHPKAEIENGTVIGRNVSIDAYAVLKTGAEIGNDTVLYSFVYIGNDAVIGDNCLIYPNVTICDKCIVGNNSIIHSGSVIGSDGFGYISSQGKHMKIPQRGVVEIGDDVEIGSNVTIDRARTGKTTIGSGTKIDNLVQIAHNVKIGENSIIVAQTGISGSTELGRNITVAGQVGFAGHIKIGDGSIVGARSGVLKSLPAKSVVSGFPAMEHRKELNLLAYYRKLPDVFKRLEALEKTKNKKR
jgi:UDP-3-O-[3-hydroxymyristoyl] glucosamine N-acyltransferase